MEVDSRMHAAAFLPTYPQHIFDSLTLSSRDFFPLNSQSNAYMSSTSSHPSLSSSYNVYGAGGGLGGRFRSEPSHFAAMQSSMTMNMHTPPNSSQRYSGASPILQPSPLQHHMSSPQHSVSAGLHSLSLPALAHPTPAASHSVQVTQSVPIISANASRRETRRSPLGGEAERAPQAAYLYEQSRMMPTSSSLSLLSSQTWSGIGGGSAPSSSGTRLPPILQVEKQQVTTSATQAASASRRRNEANFQCPVPGCGSTFTRRFNLRGALPELGGMDDSDLDLFDRAGHLRSHTEERPFVCEWPGCGKGFARQHDCKYVLPVPPVA